MAKLNRRNLPSTMIDKNGDTVDTGIVREEHLKKHLVVENIFKQAVSLEKKMITAKKALIKKIISYEKWLVAYNKMEDAKFENITLTNYDATKQIQIKSGKIIEFDETLQLAKAKIDECFAKWGHASHPNIKAVVDKYFKVDKKGFINKGAIFGLFQFEMNDSDWDMAMELIKKSIVETSKKEYLMLRTRKDKNSEWENVNLNFSTVSTEG